MMGDFRKWLEAQDYKDILSRDILNRARASAASFLSQPTNWTSVGVLKVLKKLLDAYHKLMERDRSELAYQIRHFIGQNLLLGTYLKILQERKAEPHIILSPKRPSREEAKNFLPLVDFLIWNDPSEQKWLPREVKRRILRVYSPHSTSDDAEPREPPLRMTRKDLLEPEA